MRDYVQKVQEFPDNGNNQSCKLKLFFTVFFDYLYYRLQTPVYQQFLALQINSDQFWKYLSESYTIQDASSTFI